MISTGFTKINLELKIGEFVAITGESGSGKSTLLNVLSGLDSYEEGEMYINGKETSHYTEKDFENFDYSNCNPEELVWVRYDSSNYNVQELYSKLVPTISVVNALKINCFIDEINLADSQIS